MLDAERYFQETGIAPCFGRIDQIAVNSLGLDDLTPFDPDKNIEYPYAIRVKAG
jgi:hypothetical protein